MASKYDRITKPRNAAYLKEWRDQTDEEQLATMWEVVKQELRKPRVRT